MFFKKNKPKDLNLEEDKSTDYKLTYMSILEFYFSGFEKVVNSFEEIDLELRVGFSEDMEEIINSIRYTQEVPYQIYTEAVEKINLNLINSDFKRVHKRIIMSDKLINESLDLLKKGNQEKDEELFKQGLSKSSEGMQLGVDAMKVRNSIFL